MNETKVNAQMTEKINNAIITFTYSLSSPCALYYETFSILCECQKIFLLPNALAKFRYKSDREQVHLSEKLYLNANEKNNNNFNHPILYSKTCEEKKSKIRIDEWEEFFKLLYFIEKFILGA